jgi:hypothetical protein
MLITRHGVQAIVELFALFVHKAHGITQGGIIEATAFSAQRKHVAAKIDGIRTIEQGGFKLFAPPGGGKEFGFARHTGVSLGSRLGCQIIPAWQE